MQNDEWLQVVLTNGIQELICLSLEGQPAAELIPGTMMVWLKVITNGRAYDRERDAPRIRSAFDILAGRCRRWPAPIDLLEAMPRIEQPHIAKLAHTASENTRTAHMTKIAELLKIGEPQDEAKPE